MGDQKFTVMSKFTPLDPAKVKAMKCLDPRCLECQQSGLYRLEISDSHGPLPKRTQERIVELMKPRELE